MSSEEKLLYDPHQIHQEVKHLYENLCQIQLSYIESDDFFLRGSIYLPSDQLHSSNNTPSGSFARYETWKISWDRWHSAWILCSALVWVSANMVKNVAGSFHRDINMAIISLVHKKGKYHSLCTSLRSISLLIKLHVEVTAGRLEKLSPRLVHYNQTGFKNNGPFIGYSTEIAAYYTHCTGYILLPVLCSQLT